ncbi:uncharacterized protein CANTADRAFT_44339 [Suhomyces tanzawaensis NRRL Y-17324]|uniref:WAC domain-containing protein n=1 Tax=Suhomyces tanzawaensis NRRL Y-17324 TaxID=984487 RepID=A0A1E4SQY8_9ASCO|nr:uncharacterized protein CANTADRAFT_44339 [Suhomyces tanzawaensis NRRL Y-17324]ODV81919.1 hypothetical protein CANTADRAFT_44339 [Suhomyces tanzawaensis NRRL Y-17324]
MVLYKRKQVTFVRPPDIPDDLSTEVFFIPESREWFLTYDQYLARMDYYHRRKFVCEITGNSCLTFFEAYESETREIKGVEKNFPEALREHILRFLQFNRITRLDQLIDKVYLVFRNDYFPGETIYIKTSHLESVGTSQLEDDSDIHPGSKQRGTIREKVQYGNSDNVTTKYLVVRLHDMLQSIVTTDKISRDRNHFTKWLIKTFIKLTMSRSHKVGAPWVVKDKFAIKYRIPQEYPEDLKHFADSTPNGDTLFEEPKSKGRKSVQAAAASKKVKKADPAATTSKDKNGNKKAPRVGLPPDQLAKIPADRRTKFPSHFLPESLRKELELDDNGVINEKEITVANFNALTLLQPSKKHIIDDLEIKFHIQNTKPQPSTLELPENALLWNEHLIEEYKEDIKTNISENNEDSAKVEKVQKIKELSTKKLSVVQEALQSWIFLNVYHSVLKLDTFTFDDFIYSMGWSLEQFNDIGRCELLDEIWCAVLSAIVSNHPPTIQQSKLAKQNDTIFGLLINLPPKKSFIHKSDQVGDGEEDDDVDRGSDTDQNDKTLKSDDEDSGNESGGEEGPKKNKIGRKSENDNEEADKEAEDEDEPMEGDDEDEEDEDEEESEFSSESSNDHNAYSLINYRNIPWHDRLRKRTFKDGNWQIILLGVLSMVEYIPVYKPVIEEVYKVLAPKSTSPSPAVAESQFYEEMDINLKFKVLTILVELLANGTLVRNYIDECLEESTVLRRNRLDNLKDYRTNFEAAQKLNVQIQEILSKQNEPEKASSNLSNGKEDTATPTVKRYRLNLRVVEMNVDEKEIASKNPDFKKAWDQRKDYLVKLEELRKDKRDIERKLTELDCQRVKLLGKDRLFNRYWWFENNGLPTFYGGTNDDDENEDEEKEKEKNEDSAEVDDDGDDVLDETYLMGRLWVQGPSNDDLRIHFGRTFEESELYNQKYNELEFENYQQQKIKSEDAQEDSKTKIKGEPSGDLIKELDFKSLPEPFTKTVSELYGVSFENNEIYRLNAGTKELIVDCHGALKANQLIKELSNLQRKTIEEFPDPLVNGTNWRYYDEPEQIDELINWLNPWGKRESTLRKELVSVKDVIVSTMEARKKALSTNSAQEEELKIENDLSKVDARIEALQKDDEFDDDDTIAPSSVKKRQLRNKSAPRKRQKLTTVGEILELGELDDLNKLKKELTSELEEKKETRDLQRVLEWVNSTALDEFDKSLYEGGDKSKVKHTRGRPPKKR